MMGGREGGAMEVEREGIGQGKKEIKTAKMTE